jgi:hypothetical protein
VTEEFPVPDENSTKCTVKFLMGAEGEEKQIGDECECGAWWRQLVANLVVAGASYRPRDAHLLLLLLS